MLISVELISVNKFFIALKVKNEYNLILREKKRKDGKGRKKTRKKQKQTKKHQPEKKKKKKKAIIKFR